MSNQTPTPSSRGLTILKIALYLLAGLVLALSAMLYALGRLTGRILQLEARLARLEAGPSLATTAQEHSQAS